MCAAAMALSAMICESSDDLDNIGEWLVGILLMAVARFAICSWPVGGRPILLAHFISGSGVAPRCSYHALRDSGLAQGKHD